MDWLPSRPIQLKIQQILWPTVLNVRQLQQLSSLSTISTETALLWQTWQTVSHWVSITCSPCSSNYSPYSPHHPISTVIYFSVFFLHSFYEQLTVINRKMLPAPLRSYEIQTLYALMLIQRWYAKKASMNWHNFVVKVKKSHD